MKRRQFSLSLAALAAAPALGLAQAAWPQRPVKFILSQPAGSGPDILARYVGDQLSKLWNQPVIVDNRPGGQNVIGAQAAARSPADGYTVYYATTAAMVTNVFTFKSLPYDPAKDFIPVRLVGRSPFVIAAGASFPVKDLADALARAKAQPGIITIATEGPKTFSGMLADSVASMAGVKLNHIPYTKATDALQDVIGGRVQLICLPDAALTAYIKGGQVQPLAISTATRNPELPNVPSLSESFPGFEYTGWNGLFVPAGTPREVILRLQAETAKILATPAMKADAIQQGYEYGGESPEEFLAFIRAEMAKWGRVIKDANIKLE